MLIKNKFLNNNVKYQQYEPQSQEIKYFTIYLYHIAWNYLEFNWNILYIC